MSFNLATRRVEFRTLNSLSTSAVSGRKQSENTKGKKSTRLKSWVKSQRSTQLNFWRKTCSILSFQQATLNSKHPPLFRKKLKSPGLNKQKTQSACRLNLKQMVKLLQKCNHFWKRGKKAPALVQLLFLLFN